MDASNTHNSASLLPSQRKLIYFLIAFGFVFYLLVLGYILLATQFMLRFTYLIPLVAIFALLTNRIKQFILDWSAFYLIIVVYDTFRALADNLNSRVNYTLLLLIERKLFFGSTPTEFLQSNFYQLLTGVPGMFLTSIYLLHFILPVMLLLYWWYTNMKLFRWYASTLALTSIVAFVFFLIFPAAPPWMIAKQNVIQANRLLMENLDVLFANSQPLVFQLSANPVAPFPSLHT